MLGAIIGDTVGSVYEFYNKKSMDFPLFAAGSEFTDDTVMTIAVAEGVMEGYGDKKRTSQAIEKAMQRYGRRYPHAGYGGRFMSWIHAEEPRPYYSYGNGSAMRVSSVAWAYDTLEDVLAFAEISAAVTHNHPEGIKGAKAVAAAIFLTRRGEPKEAVRDYIETHFDYVLNRTADEIRTDYSFDVSCQGSVPEAIIAYLDSTDFENAIRLAVSIGGDSDTIAAITGSIAEAAYGVPEWIGSEALGRLDPPLLETYRRFQAWLSDKNGCAPRT